MWPATGRPPPTNPHLTPPHPPAGALAEYVKEEVNCRLLSTCADQLRYATVRAEPEWGVLGKRLGKAMGAVAAGVKALGMEQVGAGGGLGAQGCCAWGLPHQGHSRGRSATACPAL